MTRKKICLIGDFGVGKTSLIRRFVDGKFSEHYLSTVGVQVSFKDVEVPASASQASQKLRLVIWDLEGSTKFQGIAKEYVEGCQGAILVADLTRQETIDHLAGHLDLLAAVKTENAKVVVAFNKADLLEESTARELLSASWQPDSERVLASYLTSAKTGENVEAAFQKLAASLLI